MFRIGNNNIKNALKINARYISILGKNHKTSYLFNNGAIKFLDEFIEKHKNSHDQLLNHRKNKTKFGFRDDTTWIRSDPAWSGSIIPDDLKRRHVEITGPSNDPKMVINALNSDADCYMSDIEDSLSPNWNNIQNAHHNIYQAIRGNLTYDKINKDGNIDKTYKVNPDTPTFLIRTRGLHLKENNILDNAGNPVPATLIDLGLHMYHNSQILAKGEGFTKGGIYFYIPKIESYEEAKYINTLFNDLQKMANLPVGTIKTTLLIETFPAIFQT